MTHQTPSKTIPLSWNAAFGIGAVEYRHQGQNTVGADKLGDAVALCEMVFSLPFIPLDLRLALLSSD